MRVGSREWGFSLALGMGSIPLGALIRLMPNAPFERLFRAIGLLGQPEILPTTNAESEGWNNAITRVCDHLGLFANLRGGRLRPSSFVVKSRSAHLHNDNEPPLLLYVFQCVGSIAITSLIMSVIRSSPMALRPLDRDASGSQPSAALPAHSPAPPSPTAFQGRHVDRMSATLTAISADVRTPARQTPRPVRGRQIAVLTFVLTLVGVIVSSVIAGLSLQAAKSSRGP